MKVQVKWDRMKNAYRAEEALDAVLTHPEIQGWWVPARNYPRFQCMFETLESEKPQAAAEAKDIESFLKRTFGIDAKIIVVL